MEPTELIAWRIEPALWGALLAMGWLAAYVALDMAQAAVRFIWRLSACRAPP